ncbi:pilus assembly protein PilP [Vibrio genomosp. F10]|uniref:Fimbrial protein n=2 Tax=Vibrio genomosp. F10 TaxID=723171 RepID=A0A1B9R191_9VIBR|nr:pilus assembly protein PilP [Vibrio genomosp. F10]OCH78069.1 fimbrial protein [Vibrio genomosp. F10]OEE37561.1 fimbrial protein [Vibrio genomosp. F10 str. ZF-129]OEE86552.1 fimbrial protein [Vibrio genomosp. F10 str. 9ZD137]OEE94710.1 fimbrial protein [Vibrio genomosp. F10 str. 9ZC157]OEF05276.1 fimbrial protein [Vibrio genomosp. F10 str. 9ZB36]
MKANGFFLFLFAGFLNGCQANNDSIDEYIQAIESQARKEVVRLEPVIMFQASAYQSTELREPFFLPSAALVQEQAMVKKDCWQPPKRTKSGPLERYPMSKLRLKGVMGSANSVSALVQTPKGQVINVSEGQFIGLNNGRVTRVTSHYVLINETLPDGLGCWSKRNVKLALK